MARNYGSSYGRSLGGKYQLPTVMARAPLNALRSHLYPVDKPAAAQAALAMQRPEDLPQWVLLPISMAQAQWKKYGGRWTWQNYDGPIQSYAGAFRESGSTLRELRADPQTMGPSQPLAQVAQGLADQMMRDDVHDNPGDYVPILRNMQYPSPWPDQPVEEFDEFGQWPASVDQIEAQSVFRSTLDSIRNQDFAWAVLMLGPGAR